MWMTMGVWVLWSFDDGWGGVSLLIVIAFGRLGVSALRVKVTVQMGVYEMTFNIGPSVPWTTETRLVLMRLSALVMGHGGADGYTAQNRRTA